MPVKEDYVKQIAGLGASTADDARDLVELHNHPEWLKHFEYDGSPDDSEKKVAFLRKHQLRLEVRHKDLVALGHNPLKCDLVRVDKIIDKLDTVLAAVLVGDLRKQIAGRAKDLCEPATLLPTIDRLFGEAMDSADQIVVKVNARKFAGIDKLLDDFDAARDKLFKEVHKIRHPRLANLVRESLLLPPQKFARGPAYAGAVAAASGAGKTTGFGEAWRAARELANARFESYTESKGKKQNLWSVLPFNQKFGEILAELEKLRGKSQDDSKAREKALTIARNYLDLVEGLPGELQNAVPNFVGPIQSELLGIIAALDK